jgi:beta-glucosidase
MSNMEKKEMEEEEEKEIPPYKNLTLSAEIRANDLVSRMTMEEKISQMLHTAKAIPKLDVPQYNWWNEALHGIANGVATVFPQSIGLGATFNPDLMFEIANAISDEGRAKHHAHLKNNDRGIFKGLTFWSPNVNIFRDPRWGRGQETYGEDPFLMGKMGVSFVKGIQGDDVKYLKAVSTPKHYVVHSGPEKLRHEFNAVVSEKDLRETYLYAFKECVKKGKAYSIMGAYNRTNGEVCCGSPTLLQKILREEFEFSGYVVSDCGAIGNFHKDHKITETAAESAALAVKNGCDLNCGATYPALIEAYEKGLISEHLINISVTRLFIARFKLGMFDPPENVNYARIPYSVVDSQKHRDLALKAARQSIVLLKNENSLLPLSKDIEKIAVIGPNAHDRNALRGNYSGTLSKFETIFEGILNKVPDTRVSYAPGCEISKSGRVGFFGDNYSLSEAITVAENSDIVILCLGLSQRLEGEEGSASLLPGLKGDRDRIELPDTQLILLREILKTGKPIVVVLLNGSPVAIPWVEKNIPAIVEAWYPGEQGGTAIADVLFGDYSPSGRLPITFVKSTDDLPSFEDYKMKGRTYRYIEKEPLYPFGYGLSFTTFTYTKVKLNKRVIRTGDSIEISVDVKNTGKVASEEVVQLYIKDLKASVTVPHHSLQGMQRINLKPGKKQTVNFLITPRNMALINNDGKCILEPGHFEVFVGGCQPDDRSKELLQDRNMFVKVIFEVIGENLELEY